MGDFNRGPRRDFGDRKMYPAKCAKCGKDCEVPFKPTEGRPVLCKECFTKDRPPRRDNRPPRRNSRPQRRY